MTEPAKKTLVTQLVGEDLKGLAFGWYNFSIGVAALPSSLIFGWLYQQFGPLAAFGWGAGLSFVAAILMLWIRGDWTCKLASELPLSLPQQTAV